MGAQGFGQGAHRSCAVICVERSRRSERRRSALVLVVLLVLCVFVGAAAACPLVACPLVAMGLVWVWFPLLFFNKKRPDLAGSKLGEHATHVARFIRRDLASLW